MMTFFLRRFFPVFLAIIVFGALQNVPAFAHQKQLSVVQKANFCNGIITYGNKLFSEYSGNAKIMEMWKDSHPGCYPNHIPVTGIGGPFAAFDAIFMTLYQVLSAIALGLFFTFAFLMIVKAGVKIVLGEDVKIALTKAIFSLVVAFGAIQLGPPLLNSVLQMFQKYGTSTSSLVFSQMSAAMLQSATTNAQASGLYAKAQQYIPHSGALDPVNIAQMGISSAQEKLQLFKQQFEDLSWKDVIVDFFDFFAGLLPTFLDVIVQIVAFTILAIDAALILFEAKIVIILSPLAFFTLTTKDFWASNAHQTVVNKTVGLSIKIFMFYILIYLSLAANAFITIKSTTSFAGNFFLPLSDIVATIFSVGITIYLLKIVGEIFGAGGGFSLGSMALGFAGGVAGAAALGAVTGGVGAAAKAAGAFKEAYKASGPKENGRLGALKSGFSAARAHAGDAPGDIAKGAFHGAAKKSLGHDGHEHMKANYQAGKESVNGGGDNTKNPDGAPGTNFGGGGGSAPGGGGPGGGGGGGSTNASSSSNAGPSNNSGPQSKTGQRPQDSNKNNTGPTPNNNSDRRNQKPPGGGSTIN